MFRNFNYIYLKGGNVLKKNYKIIIVSTILLISLLASSIAFAQKVLPLSGNEPKYEPNLWNKNTSLLRANCYAYAVLQVCSRYYAHKIQPGEFSHGKTEDEKPFLDSVKNTITSTISDVFGSKDSAAKRELVAKVKKDLAPMRDFYETTADVKAPKGYRKVALVIDPGKDYHWYMQNEEGFWSHKPGLDYVTNKDATGKIIWDPENCDRNYGNLNYTEFCGYFMVE